MRHFLTDLRDHWEGWAAIGLVIVTVMMCSGCNQQLDRPWPHEPTPDHWLESYWLSPEEHAAKRQWERETPPLNFADKMTR